MATGDAHLRVVLLAALRRVRLRDADAVQRAADADSVLFASERTLFARDLAVSDWQTTETVPPRTALDALATLEADVPGRIAAAVRAFVADQKARAASNAEVIQLPGEGLVGDTPWGNVMCGTRSLLLKSGISTGLLEQQAALIETGGRRAIFLAIEDSVAAVFAVEERFAPAAEESIQQLRRMGLETAMITSAEVAAAQGIADRLGIDTVYFETPEEKMGETLHHIGDSGGKPVLVGRGIAFEEHFRAAHAAISLDDAGTTSQAGFDAAGSNLKVIPYLMRISRRAHQSAVTNLVLAIGTGLFGTGLAVAGAAPSLFLIVGAASFLVSAGCTFNAPFPALERVYETAARFIRRIRRRKS
jgi:Cu+-exporting ATPase